METKKNMNKFVFAKMASEKGKLMLTELDFYKIYLIFKGHRDFIIILYLCKNTHFFCLFPNLN